MIHSTKLKVCGITSLVDAEAADALGADYLGFIFYPKSPRHSPLAQYEAMKDRLPARKKVAVSVEPTAEDLRAIAGMGFDFFQVHGNPDALLEGLPVWMQVIERRKLWLAPRLRPGTDVPDALLARADTFVLDTFHPDKPGGTGKTGDWEMFRRHREKHPEKQWILAGGLNPENIGKAVAATGATFVDVNSGVEQSPGVKSPAKLKAFALALQQAARPARK
jgi:phosphoribosylanthranilate isomerase